VINNHTIPVAVGGQSNLLAMLTTYYLPQSAGYILAVAVVAILALSSLRGRRERRAHGLPVDDGELTFLKLFITAQLIFLFVIVTNQFRGIPLPALILAGVASVAWVLPRHTPFGRYLYAIGGNEEAAIISGIPVRRVTVAAFVLMGAVVAITGFMQTAYGGVSTTTVGDLMELDAVAACVIGGVSLKGGRGTVLGVLFGALIMACLINGMTLLAVEPEKKFIARGLVLILAVWMDVRLGK
jgi:D-xylose transport system permease protein